MDSRVEQIEQLKAKYPDLPAEAIYKEDMLRTGIGFSEDSLLIASGFKPKAYFIFSFDLVPISEMSARENFRVPEEIALEGGKEAFRRVIVSVRVNPSSPYRVEVRDGRLVLCLEGEEVADVVYPEYPEYYRRKLSSGKPVTDIAPTIEWGYLLYLTVFRLCQYFGRQEECQFCDINENYRQQKKSGRSYTGVKSPEEIVEALEIIAETDSDSRAYTVTGGSVTSELQGKNEVEFYSQYPEAIERRFPGRWISKVVVQALPREQVQRFKDVGVQIYHPNYEVWDPRLFEIFCAGKTRYIGRSEWIRRILDAAGVFGPEHVIPNFVAGIEMSRPNGFETVEQALASTGEGLDFFMSHGVVPRFTTWCPEPLSVLGKDNAGGAPLEYHVGLLRVWRDTLEKYGLPAPPGYGVPGIGQAVFSVSSFMDVVRNGGQNGKSSSKGEQGTKH
ncbi:MAG: radical SAM protein [Acidobacteriota bacterium]|nr:MAG: radical SAM protein [Acidobacteriota bacterium]